MTAFIGMTTEKGVIAADSIEGLGRGLQLALTPYAASVVAMDWVGQDREEFLQSFAVLKEQVVEFAGQLVALGSNLREQAMAQTQASSAMDGAGASSATASTPASSGMQSSTS